VEKQPIQPKQAELLVKLLAKLSSQQASDTIRFITETLGVKIELPQPDVRVEILSAEYRHA
jgi:hypothetical protein